MSSAIIERIKKLLALGRANSGATEAEAETAMAMAAALMARHGIEVNLDDDARPEGAIVGEWVPGCDEEYHRQCAEAVGYLYSCRGLFRLRSGEVCFVGRKDNTDAAVMTLAFLVGEIDRLYKLHLPKGLSKTARANYRRTFKFACAHRLAQRAWRIMQELRNDDQKAIAATGRNALVVVQSIDQQLKEASSLIDQMDTRKRKPVNRSVGLGTLDGIRAGDTVQLNKSIT